MIITANITSTGDGNTWMGRFPMLDVEIEDLKGDDGGLDYGKVRAELGKHHPAVRIGDRDTKGIIAIGLQFLHDIYHQTKQLEADPSNDCRLVAEKPVDRRLSGKMKRESYAFVRVRITGGNHRILMRLEWANPHEVVGEIGKSCREYAVYCARIMNRIRRDLRANNRRLQFEAYGEGDFADIFREAAFADRRQLIKDRIAAANAKRSNCLRHVGSYCSPIDTACACHVCGGYCAEAELPRMWNDYSTYKSIKLGEK